jgi:hypothetical protein
VAGTLLRYVRRSLELPPRVVLAKGSRRIAAAWRTRRMRARDLDRGTWQPDAAAGALAPVFALPAREALAPHAPALAALAREYLGHRFDLLGSGWTRVEHGMTCSGVEGHAFPPARAVAADSDGQWLAGELPPACLPEARRIWRLVSPGYRPIDWQLDFKSGFRWSARTWYRDIRAYGNPPGADIKVPWELARGQHLPQLALAFAATGDDADRNALHAAFRDQVLDFIAANPPRFGVNWACAMDVAIRVANWIAAFDLARAAGASPDPAFAAILARSVREHALHVADNLEWTEGTRSNHYLADVCGLLIAAAALPAASDTDAWLAFALQELERETQAQFHEEGGNIEASTCYHRLSGEMVVYATAAALGLPEARVRGLARVRPVAFAAGARLDGVPACVQGGRVGFSRAHAARIAGIAAFVRDLSKPSGAMPQIGDNDSGRFLKLPGTYAAGDAMTAAPVEDTLDHRHLVAAAAGLVTPGAQPFDSARAVDAAIVRGLARDRVLDPPEPAARPVSGGDPAQALAAARARQPQHSRRYVFTAERAGLRVGLAVAAYPAFGLYVARSPRLYLAFRCGRLHAGGSGGHAHLDQLAIELEIDGVPRVVDPGTFLYTPLPEARNRYRSAASHFVPRVAGAEPGDLSQGLFVLADRTQAACTAFGTLGFAGEHRGYGAAVVRVVTIADDRVEVEDCSFGAPLEDLADAPGVPVSPAYGRREP